MTQNYLYTHTYGQDGGPSSRVYRTQTEAVAAAVAYQNAHPKAGNCRILRTPVNTDGGACVSSSTGIAHGWERL